MTEPDAPVPPVPTRRVTHRAPRLGKADAERLLAAIDDDVTLRALLVSLLSRLVSGDLRWTEDQVVGAAARTAGWSDEHCRRLLGSGPASRRARVGLAVDLAELRRLV